MSGPGKTEAEELAESELARVDVAELIKSHRAGKLVFADVLIGALFEYVMTLEIRLRRVETRAPAPNDRRA